MTDGDETESGTPIRETYEEYDLDAATVAMIADPENEHAWIQSDVTRRIAP